MDLEGLHVKYQELDKSDVIKKGDTISFNEVAFEIEKIYEWESDFYKAVEYRKQLPEETQESIINEFRTVMERFTEIVRLRTDDIPNLASRKQELSGNIKRLYKTLYDLFVQDYRGWRIDKEGSGFIEELEQRAKRAEESLTEKGEQEVTKIIATETTEEWAQEYSKYIDPDKLVRNRLNESKRKLRQTKDRRSGRLRILRNSFTSVRYWFHSKYIILVAGTALYGGHSYLNISYRWRFWRAVFYLALLVLAVVYFVYFLQTGVPKSAQYFDYFIQKLAFLPLIVILTVGLVFASRNYRINSNLLEEYKHRYVVAKTIQNLLLLPEIKKNAPLQRQLLDIGTKILFEHRASGYMGKDSDEKLINSLLSQLNYSGNKK